MRSETSKLKGKTLKYIEVQCNATSRVVSENGRATCP